MSKGSGGTRSTNSKSTHSRGDSISNAVSRFNSMKLDSAQAFDAKSEAMISVMGEIGAGYQVDLSSKSLTGRETVHSFVKNSSGSYVQKHIADRGELNSAPEQWSASDIANQFLDTTMRVKKYEK